MNTELREIAMNGAFIWVLLFLGNVALMLLWVHYIVRVLFGKCPHCGEARTSPLFRLLGSIGKPLPSAGSDSGHAHNH